MILQNQWISGALTTLCYVDGRLSNGRAQQRQSERIPQRQPPCSSISSRAAVEGHYSLYSFIIHSIFSKRRQDLSSHWPGNCPYLCIAIEKWLPIGCGEFCERRTSDGHRRWRRRQWGRRSDKFWFTFLLAFRWATDRSTGCAQKKKLRIQSFLISTYNFGLRKNSLLSRITC